MDIAALSTNVAQVKLAQAVGISVLKMAQDSAAQQNDILIQAMQQSVQPHLGKTLDIKA